MVNSGAAAIHIKKNKINIKIAHWKISPPQASFKNSTAMYDYFFKKTKS